MKHCRACKKRFEPQYSSLQITCSPKCAISIVQQNKQKENRAALKKFNENDRGYMMKKAQAAVNAYVRLRDSGKPCISCGKPDTGSHQRHASHYRPAHKNAQHRFNPINIWASCQQCNTANSGNLIGYRISLIDKIGVERVEWLENTNTPVRYTVDQLKRITAAFLRRRKIHRKIRSKGAATPILLIQ